MKNEELNLEEMMNKIADEEPVTEEKEILLCPVCNESLMYMEQGNTLYCQKCEKFFKNDNGTVGEEATNPYKNKNAMY